MKVHQKCNYLPIVILIIVALFTNNIYSQLKGIWQLQNSPGALISEVISFDGNDVYSHIITDLSKLKSKIFEEKGTYKLTDKQIIISTKTKTIFNIRWCSSNKIILTRDDNDFIFSRALSNDDMWNVRYRTTLMNIMINPGSYPGNPEKNNDISYPTQSTTMCTGCRGTGTCQNCFGSGTYSRYGVSVKCSCTNGKCPICGGKGRY